MTLNYPQGAYPFPDEFAPPKKKAQREYQLQYAKAMFYSKNRQGYSIYSQSPDNQNLNALIELAQGRASTDNIRRMFGFYTERQSTSQDNQSLAYIDIQVINFATEYINRAVAKLQKYKFKIGLSAADPISVNEAKEYDAKIKCYYALKDYYATMGQQAQQFYQDLNIEILPKYPEEIIFNLTANQKIRKIIDGEKTIQLVNNVINDLGQIMREFDWWQVVLGRAHIHCYHDENGMPRNESINPKYWLGSYIQNEDFRKQEYSGFVDFLTVNQFKKEAENKLTKEEMDSVLKSHAFPNTLTSYTTLPDEMVNFDGLRYIPVMRYYFLSNDHTKIKTWKDGEGNTQMERTHYQYTPRGAKKEEDMIPQVYTTVYGGSWVVDSEVIYNEGPKDIPRSNLVNARLPIITFAPNMKNGRYVSLLSQLIEPLTMFNVAWNKVKDVLAKGRLGIMNINLTAFENIALGKGGENWSAKEAIDFLFQTGVGVSRQQTNPHGTAMAKNVDFTATGVTLADYFTTMTTCIQIMDKLAGSTLADTNELPDRLTSKTMVANVAAGSDAIEYLINSHQQAYYQVTHMNLLLTQAAKRNKNVIKGMIPALGKYTTEYFEVPDELPYCDYGLSMEREATPEEWMDFYAQIAGAIEKGLLNASDSAFLREIPDMTMARFAMATREQINEKKAAEMRQQEMQFQQQTAQEAMQMKMQMDQQAQAQKHANDMELAILQGKIDEALLEKEAMLKGELQGMSDVVQERIKRQAGIDSIIKESLRSKAEADKALKQHDSKVTSSQIQSATQLATAQIAAKAKPKPAAKK